MPRTREEILEQRRQLTFPVCEITGAPAGILEREEINAVAPPYHDPAERGYLRLF
jgi:hypothetical protein